MLNDVQQKIKGSTSDVFLWIFKLFSGYLLGLTFALIGDEIYSYSTFAFVFVTSAILLAFLKIAKNWRFVGVLVFNLICVLVGLLLRMYILVAPGT